MFSVGLASAPENMKNKARRAEPAGFVTAAEGSGAASAFVRAFSGEVDPGSPSENATTQREKSEARFYQNEIRSSHHELMRLPPCLASFSV
jgi:hypothetical protein